MDKERSEQTNIPEDLLTSPDELAGQLIQSHQIAQDLSKLLDDRLRVIRTQIEWDVDMRPALKQILHYAQHEVGLDGEKLHSKAAIIQSHMGSTETAEESIALAKQYDGQAEFYAYIDLGKAYLQKGVDPEEAFGHAREAVLHEEAERYSYQLRRAQLIKVYEESDIDPEPFISQLLEKEDASWRYWGGLATELMDTEHFEHADMLLEKLHTELGDMRSVKPDRSETKLERDYRVWDINSLSDSLSRSYEQMSRKLLSSGDIEGAIDAALKTDGNNFVHMLAEGSTAFALQGDKEIALQVASRAMDMVERYDGLVENQESIYASVAVTHELCGEESNALYKLAEGKALAADKEEYVVWGFINIAKARNRGGLNTTSIFDKALEWVDKVPLTTKEDIKHLPIECFEEEEYQHLDRDGARKDVIHALINQGYYDRALKEVDKITTEILDRDVSWIKTRVLLERANHALKPRDIRNLPQEAIAAILAGDNEDAYEAVKFFRLDKEIK